MPGRVYIACGGTGGHLAPGIATAQRLMEKGVEVVLVVSDRDVDSRLMQAYPGIPSLRQRGRAFGWKPQRLLPFCFCLFLSLFSSWQLVRRERPRLILAFGGFMSVSLVLAGRLAGIPVILHEANRKPGRTVRILSRMAEAVFLPEGVPCRSVEPRRLHRLGLPVRREVVHIPKEAIRRKLDIPLRAKVLLVVGGSQGAASLNDWVRRRQRLLAADGIWVLLVSGPGKLELPPVQKLSSDAGEPVEIRCFAFHNALHELFSCADVVVSRAGAGTIAEMAVCLAPGILVPYPHAADNHQLANASYLERRGGCILIEEDKLESLYREVLDLIYNDWMLAQMRKNLRALGKEDAAGKLARFILSQHLGENGQPDFAGAAMREEVPRG